MPRLSSQRYNKLYEAFQAISRLCTKCQMICLTYILLWSCPLSTSFAGSKVSQVGVLSETQRDFDW